MKTFPSQRFDTQWPREFMESCMRAANYQYVFDGAAGECPAPYEATTKKYCWAGPIAAWWRRL